MFKKTKVKLKVYRSFDLYLGTVSYSPGSLPSTIIPYDKYVLNISLRN